MFATERLAEFDDPARVSGRYLDFFIGLAARAGAGLGGSDAAVWNARLAADLADLRAAMAWAVEVGRAVAVLDIAEPTRRFWYDLARYSELERWLLAAVDATAATDTDRARALVTASLVMFGSGHLARAHGLADRAASVARAVEAENTLALGLGRRASAGHLSGLSGSEQNAAADDETIALAERLEGDAITRAIVLTVAGVTACYGRSLGEGQELLEQAVAVCEDAGEIFHRPTLHGWLATWLLFSGELDRARQHAQQGVARARRIDRPGWEAVAVAGLAVADLLEGDIDVATEKIADAEELLRARGT